MDRHKSRLVHIMQKIAYFVFLAIPIKIAYYASIPP